MDIRSKLRLSECAESVIPWFRERGKMRLYQGALFWAEQQGLVFEAEVHEPKILGGGANSVC